MFKKTFFLLIAILLSACGTLEVSLYRTATPNLTVTIPTVTSMQPVNIAGEPLSMDSSSEAIQQKMLRSALTWSTIWMDGTVKENLAAAPVITRQQVWIDQSRARFRFLAGPVDANAVRFKVSDGISRLEMDIVSGATQMSTMPEGIAGQFAPQFTPGIASPNPIWGQIGEPLAGMAFPSDRAQNEGVFKPIAIELVADRQALVVDWTYIANAQPSWRMWLDVQTGVTLKEQNFDKGGGDTVKSELLITQVLYDIPSLPAELFSVNPAKTPAFSDVIGTPLNVSTPAAPVPVGSDPLGEVYFFALTPGDDTVGARLMRLPGSCTAGKQACPVPEQLNLPGKTYANLGPALAWSRDGKKVAFLAAEENGRNRLFVSAMPVPDWKQIAEFPLMDLPAWSGDGNWISFRVQDGNGDQDYYVVRPDGTDLKNVTATDKLPAEDRPYSVDGWITNNLIVRSVKPGSDGAVYLLRVDDGRLSPLFDTLITKALFHPSPDGSLLVFDEYDNESKVHTLRIIAPDGSGLRDLATFKSMIYPITWSPDGTSLAFAVYAETPGSPSGVYVIDRDGRGLKQVHTGPDVMNLVFSPNGRFLLIEGGMRQQIFAVDLDTLEARLVQPPGLNLSDWQRQPAWVP